MGKEIRVNVYEDEFLEGNVISRVRINTDLDYWNGSNWSSGSLGRHKGLTKLRNGSYVLIFTSCHTGEKDYAYVISKERALQEILQSQNLQLLKRYKYKELRDLYNQLEKEEV